MRRQNPGFPLEACVATNNKEGPLMLEQEKVPDLVMDLEQRIDEMQNMGDEELGSFSSLDWAILILISIVFPILVLVVAR